MPLEETHRGKTQEEKWKSQMKKESEIGVVQPQAKECQQHPGAGEDMERLFALEPVSSSDTIISASGLQNGEERNSVVVSHPVYINLLWQP